MARRDDGSDPDVARRLEDLERPTPPGDALRRELRLTLLDARPSSRIGFTLVGLPAIFLCGVVLRYGFGWPVPGFAFLEDALGRIEQSSYASLLSPLILVVAPFVALVLNLLAVVHVRVERARRELQLSVKLRWANLLVIGIAGLIIALVFVHLVSERAHHLR